MNLSNVLSVAIGLALLYYVLSLIVSYITTTISRLTQMRAKDLHYVLRERLQDPETYEQFMSHPLIKNLKPMQVKLMGREIWDGDVSQIPAPTFATALFDVFAPASKEEDKLEQVKTFIADLPESEFKTSLACMVDSTVQNIQTARENVEYWYNDVMTNVSRLYTQHARRIAIISALVISVGLDVDSVTIANTLWTEPTVRAAAQVKAEKYVNQAPAPEEANVAAYVAELEELEIPILWSTPVPQDGQGWSLKVLGWAITWLAIAQGSSFWYDMLRRVKSVSSDTSNRATTG